MIGNYVWVKPGQLDKLINGPGGVPEFLDSEFDSDNYLNIDKSWEELHYLLTGSAYEGEPPLSYVVLGGKELGSADENEYPYGQPRYITPEQVQEANQALQELDMDKLRRRYNAAPGQDEAYVELSGDDDDELPEDILYFLNEITAFFKKAAESGEAIVFWIS
jgi:hypothetical protein